MNLAVDGSVLTLQTINLDSSTTSNVTANIGTFVPDTSPGIISIGKAYGHSGATNGYIVNVKIYEGSGI